MSLLASLSLTSLHTLKVVAALAVFSLLVGAFLLPRWAPRRFPRTARHRLGRAALILVPMLLVTSSGALVLNRSLGLVKTSGDLGELIASTIVGEDAQSGGEATIANQPIDPASLDATFTRTDDGMLTTTWTGPISGITLPVFVIAPRDYSPTDGKTYAVIELLHGYPGEADGTTQGAHVQEALDNAIDAGIIPPTIIVVPSLSVDEEAHDCADIEGRPAVYTWAAREIPAFIRHNFPGASDKRDAWMLGGFSAGAYCAVWTAMRTPQTFGSAASLSGYDTQIEGQMTNQGDQYLADNTLSTMLAKRVPDGLRIYAMAAADDGAGGAPAAIKMAEAVKAPATVTTDVPPTGGHAGPLWREHIPTMLAWWGSSDRVATAVGSAPTAQVAQASDAYASIVPATTVTRSERPTAPNGVLALIVLILATAAFVTATWRFAGTWRTFLVGDTDQVAARSRFFRLPMPRIIASLPRPIAACVTYLARLGCLSAAALAGAALIGVCANMAGGFYTSWGSVAESIMEGLR